VDIPKFQFSERTEPVGAIIRERLTVPVSATPRNIRFLSYFLILPAVPAKRWNLGILE
jgi:hypothetical protein